MAVHIILPSTLYCPRTKGIISRSISHVEEDNYLPIVAQLQVTWGRGECPTRPLTLNSTCQQLPPIGPSLHTLLRPRMTPVLDQVGRGRDNKAEERGNIPVLRVTMVTKGVLQQ